MAHPQSTPRGSKATQRLSIGQREIKSNSTGFMLTAETALPTTDGGDYKLTLVVNSTGVAGLAINTTGTTWAYFKTTATINTT